MPIIAIIAIYLEFHAEFGVSFFWGGGKCNIIQFGYSRIFLNTFLNKIILVDFRFINVTRKWTNIVLSEHYKAYIMVCNLRKADMCFLCTVHQIFFHPGDAFSELVFSYPVSWQYQDVQIKCTSFICIISKTGAELWCIIYKDENFQLYSCCSYLPFV